MVLDEKLELMGFTKNESRIYLELLQIGPQAVSVVAKRLKFNRTTTYSILKSLQLKGIVASFKNGKVSFFVANDPNSLIGYMDQKCKTFDYYRTELLGLIPKIRDLAKDYDFKKPVVSYFDGLEGVKYVMYDALKKKEDCYAFTCLHKWFDYGHKDFLLEYKKVRISDKKVNLKLVTPDTKEIRAYFKDNYNAEEKKYTDVIYLPGGENMDMLANEMNIYDHRVAIMHLEPGDEYAVIIESKEIATMQKSIFEVVWNRLKSVN